MARWCMIMLQIQSVLKVCALATPLLLLAQCTPESAAPVAPPVSQVEGQPCLDNPDRGFDIVKPLAGATLCAGVCRCGGACSRLDLKTKACGEWVAKVEAWYNGEYHLLGQSRLRDQIPWNPPTWGSDYAVLRVTLTDELGLVGVREVTTGPIVRRSRPNPQDRD